MSNLSKDWRLVTAATSVAAITAVRFFYQRHKEQEKIRRKERLRGGRIVPLLNPHDVYFMDAASPGIITVFEGSCPIDYLQSKVAEIVTANPWLLSRLVTDPETAKPALWVPELTDGGDFSADSLLKVVSVKSREQVRRSTNPAYHVASGSELLDCMDLPLFKMTLQHCDEANTFSILCSMNHTMGDAATLYSIWDMLSEATVVRALRVDRFDNWKNNNIITSLHHWAFQKFQWWFFYSDSGPFQGWWRGTSAEATTVHCMARHVNPEWIQREKALWKESGEGVPYVSSNDVLVSWFFRKTQPAAGAMAYSLRDRNPGVSSQLAGNYNELLVLYPDEYMDPTKVRWAVSTMGAAPADKKRMKAGPGHRCGIVSAWHSHYRQDLNFPGAPCRQTMHSIAMPMDVTPAGRRYTARWVPVMILFCTGKDRLGVVCLTSEPLSDTRPLEGTIELLKGLASD